MSTQHTIPNLRLLFMAIVLLSGCSATASNASEPDNRTPTPVTRAARTAAARGTATPMARFPTAIVYLDPGTGRPVWPTPPAGCAVSASAAERPDLGPTIGEAPIWMAAVALPVLPWRNEFVRTVWIVDRAAEGDLVLSGRRTDGEGAVRFIRPGAERVTEQLHIQSASRVGAAAAESPTAARYADIQVQLALPGPGCYELTAKLGDIQRTFTMYIYN